jgi:hypothetical protein
VINSLINILLTYYLKVVPESGFIQALCHQASKNGPWVKGRILAKAIKWSSIAAVACLHSNGEAVHVYYQDPNLHLREHVWSPGELRWVSGEHVFTKSIFVWCWNAEL